MVTQQATNNAEPMHEGGVRRERSPDAACQPKPRAQASGWRRVAERVGFVPVVRSPINHLGLIGSP